MIDSGAMANFMDSDFATHWAIPQQPVTLPVLVETIDGWLLQSGSVLSSMTRIRAHVDALAFYMAAAPHFPLMFGLEWLQAHDPQII